MQRQARHHIQLNPMLYHFMKLTITIFGSFLWKILSWIRILIIVCAFYEFISEMFLIMFVKRNIPVIMRTHWFTILSLTLTINLSFSSLLLTSLSSFCMVCHLPVSISILWLEYQYLPPFYLYASTPWSVYEKVGKLKFLGVFYIRGLYYETNFI